ncbi:MAG: succinate dehydrogenase, partial [Bacteroidetes bacterium]|nr:succinate dehydrogenase [Bacteroidota bacterium]
NRYITLIKSTGYAFAIIVSIGFAMMPVSFYLHWVD